MSTKYVVMDGIQPIEFQGTLLGQAASSGSVRWTEIEIYRTSGGNYVYVKTGRSVIYHASGSGCSETAQEITGDKLPDTSVSCWDCDPPEPEDDDFNPEDVFEHERNFSRVKVVDDPTKLQDALSSYDKRRNEWGLSPVALEALNKAAASDPSLLNLILTPVHIP